MRVCFEKNREAAKELRKKNEKRKSNETGTTQVDDHNWSRKRLRFSVQKVGDVSALVYREKETGDSKRPPLRVVAIEDLWGTLVDVHGQVGHVGRQRMDTHLRGHGTHVPRPVNSSF